MLTVTLHISSMLNVEIRVAAKPTACRIFHTFSPSPDDCTHARDASALDADVRVRSVHSKLSTRSHRRLFACAHQRRHRRLRASLSFRYTYSHTYTATYIERGVLAHSRIPHTRSERAFNLLRAHTPHHCNTPIALHVRE